MLGFFLASFGSDSQIIQEVPISTTERLKITPINQNFNVHLLLCCPYYHYYYYCLVAISKANLAPEKLSDI